MGLPHVALKSSMGNVNSASFSPDGLRIVTGNGDGVVGRVTVWNAKTSKVLCNVEGQKSSVNCASFSPDGTRIATGSDDGRVIWWDVTTGGYLGELKGRAGHVYSMSFSPDGTRIVTAHRGIREEPPKVTVWDANIGTSIRSLMGHGSADITFCAAFSPDGSRIVTGGTYGDVGTISHGGKVWDANTGALLFDLRERHLLMGESVTSVSFSPDGKRIVTGSDDKSGEFFNPDRKRIVNESFSKTVKVWDANSGEPLLHLKGHTGGVKSVSFSPDGSRILTASVDKTATIWDAKTGTPLLVLKGHNDSVNCAAFSQDGTQIVTGSDDGTARIWDGRPMGN